MISEKCWNSVRISAADGNCPKPLTFFPKRRPPHPQNHDTQLLGILKRVTHGRVRYQQQNRDCVPVLCVSSDDLICPETPSLNVAKREPFCLGMTPQQLAARSRCMSFRIQLQQNTPAERDGYGRRYHGWPSCGPLLLPMLASGSPARPANCLCWESLQADPAAENDSD